MRGGVGGGAASRKGGRKEEGPRPISSAFLCLAAWLWTLFAAVCRCLPARHGIILVHCAASLPMWTRAKVPRKPSSKIRGPLRLRAHEPARDKETWSHRDPSYLANKLAPLPHSPMVASSIDLASASHSSLAMHLFYSKGSPKQPKHIYALFLRFPSAGTPKGSALKHTLMRH